LKKIIILSLLFVLSAFLLSACGGTPGAPTIITASGDITNAVEEYRQLLGAVNNGGDPGAKGINGYREINWDSLPDDLAAPNFYISNFFNAPDAPRARGIVLNTPGDGLMVSADSDNPYGALPRFGNINPQYADVFKTFSDERLFSPIGSNIVNITFFVPGTNTPAAVRGFGAVYTDVDTNHTAFEFFDKDGNSLGSYETPLSDNGISFLGIAFPKAVVVRVEVRYGTGALGPDDGTDGTDVAVMDNFIFGEPQAVK
jgi:predicted small secreted protein